MSNILNQFIETDHFLLSSNTFYYCSRPVSSIYYELPLEGLDNTMCIFQTSENFKPESVIFVDPYIKSGFNGYELIYPFKNDEHPMVPNQVYVLAVYDKMLIWNELVINDRENTVWSSDANKWSSLSAQADADGRILKFADEYFSGFGVFSALLNAESRAYHYRSLADSNAVGFEFPLPSAYTNVAIKAPEYQNSLSSAWVKLDKVGNPNTSELYYKKIYKVINDKIPTEKKLNGLQLVSGYLISGTRNTDNSNIIEDAQLSGCEFYPDAGIPKDNIISGCTIQLKDEDKTFINEDPIAFNSLNGIIYYDSEAQTNNKPNIVGSLSGIAPLTIKHSLLVQTQSTDWEKYTIGTKIGPKYEQLSNDEIRYYPTKVLFKNKSTTLSINQNNYVYFDCSNGVTLNGSIQSLLNNIQYCPDYCFYKLFTGCSGLISAPVLPATDIGEYSYAYMFEDCTSLIDPPLLMAKNLSPHCYQGMFNQCKSLTNIPYLPATTLKDGCYQHMFYGCSKLTKLPNGSLPAMDLAPSCYLGMFMYSGVTDISEKALPAMKMKDHCYANMFYGVGTGFVKLLNQQLVSGYLISRKYIK